MSQGLVSVTINGKSVQVPSDTTVFQAAERAGIKIPHYCYHPDLSIAGQCRMCLVDIEKNPRMQVSCNTRVAEGMVVSTDSPRVKEAVKGVLELHLVNHPLDCPICDKAGECGLQNFYMDYGLYKSRMDFEKVHKPKVQDIGTIILDSERCILCTRCVRFTNEVTHTNELVVVNRGDRSLLKTFDNGPLKNDYTGNLADICPVGALTAKDFRFQCRVWFLEKTKTICTLCARGCNTTVSVKDETKQLYRVEPRRNPKVNSSWICDEGRWGYHHVYENRVEEPIHLGKDSTWDLGFKSLKEKLSLSGIVFLSGHLTNEEMADAFESLKGYANLQFARLAKESEVGKPDPEDKILRHSDKTPNSAGFSRVAASFQIPVVQAKDLDAAIKKAEWVWFFGLEGKEPPGLGDVFKKIEPGKKIVFHSTNILPQMEVADFVFPNVSGFEKTGTMINALGRLQKLESAIPRVGLSRDLHALLKGLLQGSDRALSPTDRPLTVYRSLLKEKVCALDWESVNPLGVPLA